MQYLGLLFSLLILFTNVWGVMLATGLVWRSRWLALAVGPWLWATLVYGVECYHGLGRLQWLGLCTTAISVGLIISSQTAWEPARLGPRGRAVVQAWRLEFAPGRIWGCGAVFLAMFFYALAWRLPAPNIDGSSEKLADFAYICSYFSGKTIPVPDAWLSPYLSAHYYSFQHYAAALVGLWRFIRGSQAVTW